MTWAKVRRLTNWATQVPSRVIFSIWKIFLFLSISISISFFNIFLLFICQREREKAQAGAVRGGSRLPAQQGVQCRTQSQNPGIMTQAEGSYSTHWATQVTSFFLCITYLPFFTPANLPFFHTHEHIHPVILLLLYFSQCLSHLCILNYKSGTCLGCLAVSVCWACDSRSQGCGFDPHIRHGAYLRS